MAVGNQPTNTTINQILTNASINLREVCDYIRKQQTYINTLGLAGLEALGFSSTDAQNVINQINYMATVSGCYYGTVQQGGSNGSGAVLFNFDNELSQLWGGQ